MSHHLSNRAWEIELKANQKLVLLALAHLGTQSDALAIATVARLVFMCGLSDSCVRAQLKALMARSFVSQLPGLGDGGARTYRLTVLMNFEKAA